MKKIALYITLVLFLGACGQKRKLLNNQWLVIDGTMKGQPIDFWNTDRIKFVDSDGNEIRSLSFAKNETTILPGINTSNISAKWKIDDDKIYLTLDSSKYFIYYGTDLPLRDMSKSQNIKNDSVKPGPVNPLSTPEFTAAMKIYEQPFDYHISDDTLVLRSSDVIIRAIRDTRIDDLLKPIKPGYK